MANRMTRIVQKRFTIQVPGKLPWGSISNGKLCANFLIRITCRRLHVVVGFTLACLLAFLLDLVPKLAIELSHLVTDDCSAVACVWVSGEVILVVLFGGIKL